MRYYGDHAYFGRGRFFRCTLNALQHDGINGEPDYRCVSAWNPLLECAPAGGH